MDASLWRFVGENFDDTLPRMTAVYVKETISDTAFAYPAGDGRTGFKFDFSTRTSYDLPPKFRFDFARYEMPGEAGGINENRPLFLSRTYYPSCFEDEIEYMNLALKGTSRFAMACGGYSWQFDFTSRAVHYPLNRTLYSVLFSDSPFSVTEKDGVYTLHFSDLDYHIAAPCDGAGLYEHDLALTDAIKAQTLTIGESGRYFVLAHKLEVKPGARVKFAFGLSQKSAENAKNALLAQDPAAYAQASWEPFLEALPALGFRDEREKKAYYKSWVTIRNNYYAHPAWGHSITESLPVYKGLWQWAISSVEWHDDQNPEKRGEWIKKALDMLIDSQREDGYITHAIYVDEKRPGERWGARGVIQTPHLAWTALRYYYATLDEGSVKRWLLPLKRYYDYICRSLDEKFENRHLWAITSSYDTGLDTTPAFHKVTYGDENGVREPYCYPAIFAAERYRYELALSQLCALFGDPDEAKDWIGEAEKTRRAADEYLWDDRKKWYGVRHADGTLDTRVGVDGLFVYVYNMIDRARADEMKDNFKKLLGTYGVRTVAEDEPGFCSDVYWRGPCWPKSASLGVHAAAKYYPDLLDQTLRGVLNMALKYPNIWECMDVSTGALAHSDGGHFCSPGMTSNVGAGDIIGSLFASHGFDFYAMQMPIPLTELKNFHAYGMLLTLQRDDAGYTVTAKAQTSKTAQIPFLTPYGVETIALCADEPYHIDL